MSNTITAYFKGRVGVAESVYQNDYGIVMAFDNIDLPAHFDCYFSRLNQEEAIPGVGADGMVAIPNSVLANPGAVTIHIPIHTGANDSEVEYVVHFKVIGRARPVDDGTPADQTAISQAIAALNTKTAQIPQDLQNYYDSHIAPTITDGVSEWLDDHPEATTTVQDGSLTEAKFTDALKQKTIKDYVTPQMFGAKGDGVTNDLASFNSVVASMSDGDVLYIPNGEYLLNDTWTISKNITVYCDGTIRVTHSKPVIILNALSNAKIDINTIEKSARVFDYVEGGLTYSIGVILKNCDTCIVNVDNLLNVTTGIVLLGCDTNGCHYNEISCNNAHTFEGIELIRQSSGGWVNGNVVNRFRWMVNTWFDNTNLVPSYMIKSLSYATSSETEAYKINANMFNNLSAEYGARQADYPISLVRLDNARGYTFNFNRVEILAKSSSLYDNFFYFTNSVYCIATIWFMINSFEANLESGTHCFIYQKTDYEGLKAASYSEIPISDFTLHQSVSYAQGQFQVTLHPATALCRLQGELVIDQSITGNATAIISNLPIGRAGHDTMSIVMGTTSNQWSKPENITYHKLFCGGANYSKLGIIDEISAGTHLFVDIEYVVDKSVIESLVYA